MLLLQVRGDLPCHCDTLRTTTGHRSELVLISMFGSRNAVRAAWARFSKAPSRSGYREPVKVGEQSVTKANGIHYGVVSTPLERGILHTVIFHPLLGHNAPDTGTIYQVGPDADRRYFTRLARWCPVPFREAWREPLWRLGRKHGAIVELGGHGLEVWAVSTKRETWEPIVRDALIAKELR